MLATRHGRMIVERVAAQPEQQRLPVYCGDDAQGHRRETQQDAREIRGIDCAALEDQRCVDFSSVAVGAGPGAQ